jgi:small subunit ribosomal protein S1
VFETVFEVGTVHKGTILSVNDKSATVSLPYGVEGYASVKSLKKEDGSLAKVDEQLDFYVLEFNKEAKRITVSHARTYSDAVEEGTPEKKKSTGGAKKPAAGGSGNTQSKMVKQINESNEKATLGQLDELAKLKEQMEKDK